MSSQGCKGFPSAALTRYSRWTIGPSRSLPCCRGCCSQWQADSAHLSSRGGTAAVTHACILLACINAAKGCKRTLFNACRQSLLVCLTFTLHRGTVCKVVPKSSKARYLTHLRHRRSHPARICRRSTAWSAGALKRCQPAGRRPPP